MSLMNSPPPNPETAAQSSSAQSSAIAPDWQIKLLYDGACPLCLREVSFLRQRDAGRGRVVFVDIAAPDYSPETNGGIDFETAMAGIHALLPDGTPIKNLEVFRRVYELLDMGWVYGITRLPGVGAIADRVYGLWADWRLPLTGRPNLATIITQRQQSNLCLEGRYARTDSTSKTN
jgi:predicted DCC family thiol-disulfide oxidoreductase YuxK